MDEFPRRVIKETTNECPYCGHRHKKPITRTRICLGCRKKIYVRTARGKKVVMTELAAHEYFGVVIPYSNKRGSPRHGLCVCYNCGLIRPYMWLLGVDHFPLTCKRCKERMVIRFTPDIHDDLNFFRMRGWATDIEFNWDWEGDGEI